jgi:hypothetical protein
VTIDPLEGQRRRRWSAEDRPVGPPSPEEPWIIVDWPGPDRTLPLPVKPPVQAQAAPQRPEPTPEPEAAPEEHSDMCPDCMRKGSAEGSPFVRSAA